MIELNPIQRQMWAMTKLFLSDKNNNCVCLSFVEQKRPDGVLSKRFKSDNFCDFIPALEKYRSGLISFYCDKNLSFEFIYCYEDDTVAFTPHNIPPHRTKYVAELFCESEFLLNIELYDETQE